MILNIENITAICIGQRCTRHCVSVGLVNYIYLWMNDYLHSLYCCQSFILIEVSVPDGRTPIG